MGKQPKSPKNTLEEFLERKSASAISTSELARRASLSLNTVKTYLRGKPVRETSVQRIHEALNAYIADQKEVTDRPASIARLYNDNRSAMDCGQDALRTLSTLVELLDTAKTKAINEGKPLDKTLEEHLRHKLNMAHALLVSPTGTSQD